LLSRLSQILLNILHPEPQFSSDFNEGDLLLVAEAHDGLEINL